MENYASTSSYYTTNDVENNITSTTIFSHGPIFNSLILHANLLQDGFSNYLGYLKLFPECNH